MLTSVQNIFRIQQIYKFHLGVSKPFHEFTVLRQQDDAMYSHAERVRRQERPLGRVRTRT